MCEKGKSWFYQSPSCRTSGFHLGFYIRGQKWSDQAATLKQHDSEASDSRLALRDIFFKCKPH